MILLLKRKADSQRSDIPVINYSIKAKTYRYIGPEEQVEKNHDSTSYNDNSSSSRRAALMNNYKILCGLLISIVWLVVILVLML
jgi:hypothetical protein